MAVKAAYWVEGSMAAENIRTNLFTHLFCAFADIDRTNYKVVADRTSSTRNQRKTASFTHFNLVVHQKSPTMKTLLSIGGPGIEGDGLLTALATMAATFGTRQSFIESSIDMARSCGFDGLDLYYKLPETAGDMKNLDTLLCEWRAAVMEESRSSCLPPLLLTAAVNYTNTNQNVPADLYPADSIVVNLDWINLMSYDFVTSTGSPNMTAPTAPLHREPICGGDGVNAWIQARVPGSKIVFGIPFYGYGWELVGTQSNGFGAPAQGPINNGAGGVETYREVTALVKEGAEPVYDPVRVASYCTKGLTWISYDCTAAVAAKVRYVLQNGLLGYFAWQLAQDDADFTLSNAAAHASLA